MKKRLFFDKTVDFENLKLFIVISGGKVREYHGFDIASRFISDVIPNSNTNKNDLNYKVFEINADFKLEKVSRYDRRKNNIKGNYKIDCLELTEKTLKDVYIRLNFIEKFNYDYIKKQTIFHKMKFKQKIIYLFFISIPLLLIGYLINNSGIKLNKLQKNYETTIDNNKLMDVDSTIEKIKIPSVIFFIPNKTEFDSISKTDKSDGIYEVASDFEYYANEIINLYKDSMLFVSYTDKKFFLIKDKLVSKKEQDFPYGIILSNDSIFKIETGVFSDIDIKNLINEFYKK